MKRTILTLSIFILTTPLFAAQINNPNCKELAGVKPGFTPQYLAVIDGFNKKGKLVGDEVDVAGIVNESSPVTAECAKNKSATIKQVRMDLKTNLGKGSAAVNSNAKSMNPTHAKCSEFVALGERLQPVAAFWVFGNAKQGNKNPDQIDEMFLERPVATLVEECRANPTASFYERAKLWFKKETKAIEKM